MPMTMASRIMCMEDFDKAFHLRLAERCCANCKHGEREFEGGATCCHPKRNDGGESLMYKWFLYNTSQCNVCDLWEGGEDAKTETRDDPPQGRGQAAHGGVPQGVGRGNVSA